MILLWIFSIAGSAIAGAVGVLVASLVLRAYRNRSGRDIDLDLYYDALDQLKHGDLDDEEGAERRPARRALIYGLYGIAIALIMGAGLWIAQALQLTAGQALPLLAVLWLLTIVVPVGAVLLGEAKRMAVLEIASILELVAMSPDEQAEEWVLHCAKAVYGGDMFGADEADTLDIRIGRADVAPITLSLRGHVLVAEAGLERTVRKGILRQLRLTGWLVNELRDTEAEFERTWSLHDRTYAEMAGELARIVESLGFPLRAVRLSKAGQEGPADASRSPSRESASQGG